eukprot:scaffold1327_cov135-Isochrysis_galbana.AAC.3
MAWGGSAAALHHRRVRGIATVLVRRGRGVGRLPTSRLRPGRQTANKFLYSSLAARLAASDWRTGASVPVRLAGAATCRACAHKHKQAVGAWGSAIPAVNDYPLMGNLGASSTRAVDWHTHT